MPLRHTKSRQLVLLSVKTAADGKTADEVFQQVRQADPGIGRATIYRNLELLTRRGEIYRFEGEDGVRQYFGHVCHQATFHCQRCGKQRSLPSQALNQYVDQKMPRITGRNPYAALFGDQTVFLTRLSAQGLCASCSRILKRQTARA